MKLQQAIEWGAKDYPTHEVNIKMHFAKQQSITFWYIMFSRFLFFNKRARDTPDKMSEDNINREHEPTTAANVAVEFSVKSSLCWERHKNPK